MPDLLRLCTAGHVDDGKSTLIGRLLYDTRSVPDDQLAAVRRASERHADGIDLSLLTDGLRAEREQGITIDVAYRYFSTARRTFILADTPGHEQYTRNMATAASTADVLLLLADARHGVRDQTRHHARIARRMGVSAFVLAVNKMDLVGFDEAPFRQIAASFAELLPDAQRIAIPVSARLGDNVATPSTRMPWFTGATLLEVMESIHVETAAATAPFRMAVQLVVRPAPDFRGYAGQITSGVVRPGDRVTVWPAGREARVARIVTADGDRAEAQAPMSVTLTLFEDLDIGRGDVLASTPMHSDPRFAATLVWMDEQPAVPGRPYLLKAGTGRVLAEIDRSLALNEVADAGVTVARRVAYDSYADSRHTGSFILIDPATQFTVAAGMVNHPIQGDASATSRMAVAERLTRVAREAHTDTQAVEAVCRVLEEVL